MQITLDLTRETIRTLADKGSVRIALTDALTHLFDKITVETGTNTADATQDVLDNLKTLGQAIEEVSDGINAWYRSSDNPDYKRNLAIEDYHTLENRYSVSIADFNRALAEGRATVADSNAVSSEYQLLMQARVNLRQTYGINYVDL